MATNERSKATWMHSTFNEIKVSVFLFVQQEGQRITVWETQTASTVEFKDMLMPQVSDEDYWCLLQLGGTHH